MKSIALLVVISLFGHLSFARTFQAPNIYKERNNLNTGIFFIETPSTSTVWTDKQEMEFQITTRNNEEGTTTLGPGSSTSQTLENEGIFFNGNSFFKLSESLSLESSLTYADLEETYSDNLNLKDQTQNIFLFNSLGLKLNSSLGLIFDFNFIHSKQEADLSSVTQSESKFTSINLGFGLNYRINGWYLGAKLSPRLIRSESSSGFLEESESDNDLFISLGASKIFGDLDNPKGMIEFNNEIYRDSGNGVNKLNLTGLINFNTAIQSYTGINHLTVRNSSFNTLSFYLGSRFEIGRFYIDPSIAIIKSDADDIVRNDTLKKTLRLGYHFASFKIFLEGQKGDLDRIQSISGSENRTDGEEENLTLGMRYNF